MNGECVRIYKPAKTAMQSGYGNTRKWVMEFVYVNAQYKDSLTDWTGSTNTLGQVRLYFDTLEQALLCAKKCNFGYIVTQEPEKVGKSPKSYANNFASPRDL